MELFTYLMAKSDHNTSVNKDLFSYLLGKNQSGTYTDYSGASLSINNTKKGKMKVNLLGNTSQTGTPTPSTPIDVHIVSGDNTINVTGKNLFNVNGIDNISSASYKINITNNNIVITDNTISSGYVNTGKKLKDLCPTLKVDDVVYLFFDTTSSVSNKNYIYLNVIWTKGTSKTITQAMLDSDLQMYGGYNETAIISNFIITKANDSTYEPYQSTSYTIHLGEHWLGWIGDYKDRFIRNSGKNLFNPTFQVEHQYLTDGTEPSPANNNYSLSNGIITSVNNVNAVGRRFLNKTNLSAGTYTISGRVKFIGASRYYMFNSVRNMGTLTDIKPSFEINMGSATGTFNFSFTLSEDVENVSISLQPMTANDGTLELSELQLEKSSSATSYEPYGTNEWYLEKKIGKVVLDGSTIIGGAGGEDIYYTPDITNYATSGNISYSNYFKGVDNVVGAGGMTEKENNTIAFINQSGLTTPRFYIKSNTFSSATALRLWLEENNVPVYYALATPTYTPITGTLKDELEALQKAQSYKGTTNINQINNDLPFNMDVSIKVGN